MKSILWQVILGAVAIISAFALALALGIVLAPMQRKLTPEELQLRLGLILILMAIYWAIWLLPETMK